MSNIVEALNFALEIEGPMGVALGDWKTGFALGQVSASSAFPNEKLEIAIALNAEVIKAKNKAIQGLGLKTDDELLPLCLLVFPCSNVRWQFIQSGIQWLSEEIYSNLTSQETLMFSSYIKPIQMLFRQANLEEVDLVDVNEKLAVQLG